VPGLRSVLDPNKFYYSGGGSSDYVVVALRDVLDGRKPVKLGMSFTDAQLPAGATVTVVSHAGGLPREVSHGHITRVDATSVYYNAGAKAAVGSAVFFAHQKDLHVIAMGFKGAVAQPDAMASSNANPKGAHEIQGVRVSRFKEVFFDDGVTAKAAPFQTVVPAGPMDSGGPSKIMEVKDMKIKLPNGQSVTYTGTLKSPANVPQGSGSAVYDHGVTFAGEWSVGNRHGPGKITKEKEGYYSTGECENDLFIGTWTKYKIADDSVMEEQHYDHTTMDTVKRHLGFAGRKAAPKEDQSPKKEAA